MFCPTCKSLMKPSPTGPSCAKCGTSQKASSSLVTVSAASEEMDEIAVFEEGQSTLPSTQDFPCPECGKRNAWYTHRQTRAADEPTTIILQCIECKAKWRKY